MGDLIVRKTVQQGLLKYSSWAVAMCQPTPKTMKSQEDNVIVRLTTEFALMIIEFSEKLEDHQKYVIARQMLRSGTSIAANVREAQNAESKYDFVHKFKIAAKESDETGLWLYLCKNAPTYPNPENAIESKLQDIQRVISKIIGTSKRKQP